MSISPIKHYQISSPLETHFRIGTCAEDHCFAYHEGWSTVCDETTSLGAEQAAYIRGDRSRRHVESRNAVGLTVFTFEAGQKCFRTHRVPMDKPELYLVNSGGSQLVHSGPDAWVDDLNTNQARLAELINRG